MTPPHQTNMKSSTPPIGYVGVDTLNNATICNEGAGLLAHGVPLSPFSVYHFQQPTFYNQQSIADFAERVDALIPVGWLPTFSQWLTGPFVYGKRFFQMISQTLKSPMENTDARLRLAAQLNPALKLARQAKKASITHLHAHWAHTATGVVFHAHRLLDIGFSFTGHANDLFVHRVGLLKKIKQARFIVCISEFHRQFYLDHGASPDRLAVVYCGIDLERFSHLADSHDAQESSDKPTRSKVPHIVSVGRLVEKKGFEHLIAASGQLRDQGIDCQTLIAGSGPLEDSLRKQVHSLGLEDRVRVTGRPVLQEDLPDLLRKSTLFALPCVIADDGDRDGLPQVLIEAMACGLPALSTRLVGIPDLVRDGKTGRLIEPGDVQALSTALAELINMPADQRHALGQPGQQWARDHFGRQQAVDRLSQLFQWAAQTPGNSPLPPHLQFASAPDSEQQYHVAPGEIFPGMQWFTANGKPQRQSASQQDSSQATNANVPSPSDDTDTSLEKSESSSAVSPPPATQGG